MINLISGKDVHILVGVPKRRVEPISTQEETQLEKEPQHPTIQYIDVNRPTTTSVENDNPAYVGEDAAAPTTSVQNMTKEKQPVEPAIV